MAEVSTDFREYVRGAAPSDWTYRWTTTAMTSRVEGLPGDVGSRNWLEFTDGSASVFTTKHALSWNALDVAASGIQDVVAQFTFNTGNTTFLVLRGSGSAGSESGYLFGYVSTTTWRIWKISAGTITTLASGTGFAPKNGDRFWIRATASSTALTLRVWRDGDVWGTSLSPEPSAATVSTTDGSFSTGWMGLAMDTAVVTQTCHFISGSSSIRAVIGHPDAVLPRGMDEWARDPEARLDGVLAIQGALRTTGVTSWFYFGKVGRRPTPPTDFPPDTNVPGALQDAVLPGVTISDTAFFADIAPLDGKATFTLANPTGGLDALDGYILAGQRAVYLMGERDGTMRGFEPVFAGVIESEPDFGDTATVKIVAKLAAPIDDTLKGVSYSGIPNCVASLTGGMYMSRASTAAFSVANFTVCGRFSGGATTGGGFGLLSARETSATARQWRIYQYHSDFASLPGQIGCDFSAAAVAKQMLAPDGNLTCRDVNNTPINFNDGKWHWFAASFTSSGAGFLMVDGVTYLTIANCGVIDFPATAIYGPTAFGGSGKYQDFRFYSAGLTEDECRSLMAARAEVDSRTVAMWRLDDNAGVTFTDYSANAYHLTTGGVLNTDYAWSNSDQGTSSMAGQEMPIRCGQTFNVPGVYADAVRFRFHTHDRLNSSRFSLANVKVRGFVIANPADYAITSDGDFIDCVAAQDTPLTVDHTPNTSPSQEYYDVGSVVSSLFTRQGWSYDKVASGAASSSFAFQAMSSVTPWVGGWYWEKAPKMRDVLKVLVNGVGVSVDTDRSGRIYPVVALPTVQPGPYNVSSVYEGPLLELQGDPRGGVFLDKAFGDNAGSNFAFSFWFKAFASTFRPENGTDAATTPYTGAPLVYCSGASGPQIQSLSDGWFCGFNKDQLFVWIKGLSAETLSCPAGLFKPDTWYYLFCKYRNTGNFEIYYALRGATSMTAAATATGLTGAPTAPTGSLVIGGGIGRGFAGAIHLFQFYNANKGPTDVQGDATVRDDPTILARSGLVSYLPLDDGSGDRPADLKNVGGSGVRLGNGRTWGSRWAPRLCVDLRTASTRTGSSPGHDVLTGLPTPRLASRRRLRPAWRVTVKYRKNFKVLSGSEIAASVTQAARGDLLSPGLEVPATNDRRQQYPDSRDVVVDSPLALQAEASRLAQMVLARFSVGRKAITLDNIRKELLLLRLGDEVVLRDPRYDTAGAAYRVVGLRGMSLTKLRGTIDLWG